MDYSKFEGMTPGPWRVKIWDYSHASPPRKELNVQTEDNLLATLAWDQGMENPYTIQNEVARANARAIAALPDLIEENKRLREALQKAADTFNDFATAEAILQRHTMANAAAIARDSTNAALKGE